MYVRIEFENTNAKVTEEILIALEDIADYDHITGGTGWLIGSTELELITFTDTATDIIHARNDGMWANVEEKAEAEVEHLF